MGWILLTILVVAFTFYYAYRQRQEARQAEKRKTFEEAMSRNTPELVVVKDVVAEDHGGIKETRDGVSMLTLPLRSASGTGPKAVVVFGNKAEELAPKIRRGTRIRATGRLTSRSFIDRAGNTTEKLELVASQIELISKSAEDPQEDQSSENS